MDEAAGNAVDDIGPYTVAAINAPGAAAGKLYPTARECVRASAQYFQAEIAALNFASDFTMAFWEYPYTYTMVAGQYNYLVSNGPSSWTGGYVIHHTHDGSLVIYLYDNTGPTHDWIEHTGEIPTLNQWNFVVWTYNITTGAVTMRLNANAEKTYTFDPAVGSLKANNSADQAFTIGCYPAIVTPTHYFDGRIGPVCFWNRVLTSAERLDLYNAGAGVAYPF